MASYEYKGKIARISYKIYSSRLELFFKIDKADVIKRDGLFYITCLTPDENATTLGSLLKTKKTIPGVKLCELYKIKDDHYLKIFAPIDKLNFIIRNLKPDVSVEIVFESNSDSSPNSDNTATMITLINEF